MFNTYGIRSVNRETFNLRYADNLHFPRSVRNKVVTALRVNNAVLNVLGYIPGVSLVSGCVRMAIGAGIIGVTLAVGDRNATRGAIIDRWYDEALRTGIAQIARGAFEALVPFGWVVNATLDVIATPMNLFHEVAIDEPHREGIVYPHKDADYPFPFLLLHLA